MTFVASLISGFQKSKQIKYFISVVFEKVKKVFLEVLEVKRRKGL